MSKFKVGDCVRANDNYRDVQILQVASYKVHKVLEVQKFGNHYCIKTDRENEWVAEAWFDLANDAHPDYITITKKEHADLLETQALYYKSLSDSNGSSYEKAFG